MNFLLLILLFGFAPGLFACDESTPTINLEEEVPYHGANFRGPFVGMRRDNQDGLGTCYANTARNLIIGASGGTMNPSFLDLALQFKIQTGELVGSILDSGNSCELINKIQSQNIGICDQGNSPLETGDSSSASGLLFSSEPSLAAQGAMLNLLRELFHSTGKLSTSFKRGTNYADLLPRTREILNAFQRNPNLQFPVPVLSDLALSSSSLPMLFRRRPMPEGFPDRYNAVTGQLRAELTPLIEGGTTAAVIREKARAALLPLEQEFGVSLFNFKWDKKLDSPRTLETARESLQYFKNLAPTALSQENLAQAACTQNDATNFLGSLENVVTYLMARNYDPNLLLGEEGKLRPFAEFAQLAIAPNCVSPANRSPLPAGIKCTEIEIPKETERTPAFIQEKRDLIVRTLRDGLPVGQSFDTGESGHINTIVGHRYNPTSRECEFLIRESQTGTSDWHSDRKILERAKNLSIVRRP